MFGNDDAIKKMTHKLSKVADVHVRNPGSISERRSKRPSLCFPPSRYVKRIQLSKTRREGEFDHVIHSSVNFIHDFTDEFWLIGSCNHIALGQCGCAEFLERHSRDPFEYLIEILAQDYLVFPALAIMADNFSFFLFFGGGDLHLFMVERGRAACPPK